MKSTRKAVTREHFDKSFWNLSEKERELLWAAFEANSERNFVEDEYSHECSMCGQDMQYSLTGRCPQCEQVWNG